MKDVLIIGAGVVVGVAVCTAAYYYHKKKMAQLAEETERSTEERFARECRTADLLEEEVHVDTLTGQELAKWFQEQKDEAYENVDMLILAPTAANLLSIGYATSKKISEKTHVLQVFRVRGTGEVLKARLVAFTDIESNLQAKLLEEDGLIVITE